jgi:hypothetical protein
MARPKKKLEEKLTETIEIRCSKKQKQLLQFKANGKGLSLSDFARGKIMGAPPRVQQANPFRAQMIKGLGQLGKIGSNLNQIARAINRREAIGSEVPVTGAQIQSALNELQQLKQELLNYLTDGHTGQSKG